MGLFAKIVKVSLQNKPLTIFVNVSILDVWEGSEYASGLVGTINHMFGRISWDKLPECISKNFEVIIFKNF